MALVPTSNGSQMIALPIKALSNTNLVNGKQIQIATISQLGGSSNSLISVNSNNNGASSNSSNGEQSTGSATSITLASGVSLDGTSTVSTGIRIPAKLTANLIPLCKGSFHLLSHFLTYLLTPFIVYFSSFLTSRHFG